MLAEYRSEKVYEILSGITGLKFKSQLKGSGILFKKLYRMIDLENGRENYLLFVNDINISFRDSTDFTEKFILFVEDNLRELGFYSEALEEQAAVGIKNYFTYSESELTGAEQYKQGKLLERLRKLRSNNL